MHRMITPPAPLPACRHGHPARLILDTRGLHCGGGTLIECMCSHTAKHAEFEDALREWCRTHGHGLPRVLSAPAAANVRYMARPQSCP